MPRKVKRIINLVLTIMVLTGGYFFANSVFSTSAVKPAAAPADAKGRFMLDVIDCGQGDAILAQTPEGYNILIDTGDTFATQEVVSELDAKNVSHIQMLIATHPHADHIGNLKYIVEHYPVDKVLMSDAVNTTKLYTDALKAIKQKKIPTDLAVSGQTYTFGSLQMQVLGPVKHYDDLNNMSVVVRMTYGDESFILTGDAEKEPEQDIAEKFTDLKSNVLKVGHHGSDTSTSDRFLKAVSPEYAAISVGLHNDYGHPHASTLKRLNRYGVQTFLTSTSGCIYFYSDGKSITVTTGK